MTEIIRPKQNETLRSVDSLVNIPAACVDGELGKVTDFLFDDEKWGIRYLVVDAGGWFEDKQVLISPAHLARPRETAGDGKFPVILTKRQVQESPLLDSDAPVSRQYELEHSRYHGMPIYWGGTGLWGPAALPANHTPGEVSEHEIKMTEIGESTLRSYSETSDYKVSATDGEIGKVADMIVDINSWKVRYLVLDIGNWLFGRKVIVDTDWVESFSYEDKAALISLAKDQIKDAPEFDPEEPINRSYETILYDFYGKPHYWS